MDQVLSHTSDKHPWFRESRLSRTNSRADWYVWADPKRDGSPPNNWPSVFGGRAWEWNPSRGQYYFHNFLAEQPDLNFHNPAVQDAVLDVHALLARARRRRLPARHRELLFPRHAAAEQSARRGGPSTCPMRSIPTTCRSTNYGKSQPENVEFLKRVRKLLDEFPGTTTVGEVGDSHIGLQLMGEYTSGGDKLHMAYTFDMLGNEFTAEHFRSQDEALLRRQQGWLAVLEFFQPRRRPPCDAAGPSTRSTRRRWRGRRPRC